MSGASPDTMVTQPCTLMGVRPDTMVPQPDVYGTSAGHDGTSAGHFSYERVADRLRLRPFGGGRSARAVRPGGPTTPPTRAQPAPLAHAIIGVQPCMSMQGSRCPNAPTGGHGSARERFFLTSGGKTPPRPRGGPLRPSCAALFRPISTKSGASRAVRRIQRSHDRRTSRHRA